MNNPNSIVAGGQRYSAGMAHDPRFLALRSLARELVQRGHSVLVEVAGGLSIRPALAREQLAEFEWIDEASLARRGKPALGAHGGCFQRAVMAVMLSCGSICQLFLSNPVISAIAWFAFFADKGTKRHPLVEQLLTDPTVPRLWCEHARALLLREPICGVRFRAMH